MLSGLAEPTPSPPSLRLSLSGNAAADATESLGWGRATRGLPSKESSIKTPLLAAEGFVIQQIQIRRREISELSGGYNG